MRTIARSIAPPLLLGVVVMLVYANSTRGVFVFDDDREIRSKEAIRSLAFSNAIDSFPRTRWVVYLSFALNYALGGLDPWGYHVVNIGIHLLATLTLFGLVRRAILAIDGSWTDYAARIAFVTALIFAVHPLQTQSVTYVVQRLESLASLFYLLTLYTLVRGATGRVPWAWYAISILSLAVATGCKEIALTAPLTALLLDRTMLSPSWRELFRARKFYYALLAIPWLIAIVPLASQLHVAQRGWGEAVTLGQRESLAAVAEEATEAIPAPATLPIRARTGVTLSEFVRSQPAVIVHYVRLFFWPDALCLDYMWQPETSPLRIAVTTIAVGVPLAAAVWLVLLRPTKTAADRRRAQFAFPVLAFFVVLAPSSTVQVLDIAFEHRMYLAVACLAVLTVIAIDALTTQLKSETARRVVFAVCAAVGVLLLGMRTVQRNDDYVSTAAIWQSTVAVAPHNARARVNFSQALTAQHRPDEALAQTSAAVELLSQPLVQLVDHAGVFEHHGARLREADRFDEAAAALATALAINPRSAKAHQGLADISARRGEFDVAERTLRAGLAFHPHSKLLLCELGRLLAVRSQFAESQKLLRAALAQDADYGRAITGVRQVLQASGQSSAAGQWIVAQAEAHPLNADVTLELAQHFAVTKMDTDPARAVAIAALVCESTDLMLPQRWSVLAQAKSLAGDRRGAVAASEQAIAEAARGYRPRYFDDWTVVAEQERLAEYRRAAATVP